MKRSDYQDDAATISPLQATMLGRPSGVRHSITHTLFLALWVVAGTAMLVLALAESSDGFLFNTLILLASEQLSSFFGLEAGTLASLAAEALAKWKLPVMIGELTLSVIFLTCAWYCLRLVARSRYIVKLEAAAMLSEFPSTATLEVEAPGTVEPIDETVLEKEAHL